LSSIRSAVDRYDAGGVDEAGAWREAAKTTHLSAAVEFTFVGFEGAR
jgi:hypothetical protein